MKHITFYKADYLRKGLAALVSFAFLFTLNLPYLYATDAVTVMPDGSPTSVKSGSASPSDQEFHEGDIELLEEKGVNTTEFFLDNEALDKEMRAMSPHPLDLVMDKVVTESTSVELSAEGEVSSGETEIMTMTPLVENEPDTVESSLLMDSVKPSNEETMNDAMSVFVTGYVAESTTGPSETEFLPEDIMSGMQNPMAEETINHLGSMMEELKNQLEKEDFATNIIEFWEQLMNDREELAKKERERLEREARQTQHQPAEPHENEQIPDWAKEIWNGEETNNKEIIVAEKTVAMEVKHSASISHQASQAVAALEDQEAKFREEKEKIARELKELQALEERFKREREEEERKAREEHERYLKEENRKAEARLKAEKEDLERQAREQEEALRHAREHEEKIKAEIAKQQNEIIKTEHPVNVPAHGSDLNVIVETRPVPPVKEEKRHDEKLEADQGVVAVIEKEEKEHKSEIDQKQIMKALNVNAAPAILESRSALVRKEDGFAEKYTKALAPTKNMTPSFAPTRPYREQFKSFLTPPASRTSINESAYHKSTTDFLREPVLQSDKQSRSESYSSSSTREEKSYDFGSGASRDRTPSGKSVSRTRFGIKKDEKGEIAYVFGSDEAENS